MYSLVPSQPIIYTHIYPGINTCVVLIARECAHSNLDSHRDELRLRRSLIDLDHELWLCNTGVYGLNQDLRVVSSNESLT